MPGAANPQAWNRYSYVLGNPLKYIDPTGHYCVGDDEDCADEAGDGPALTGTGGNNSNGGGGGGNCNHNPDCRSGDDEDEALPLAGQCTNILGEYGGCANYFSVSLGLDAPTIMMLSGLGLSWAGLPQAGVPLALSGAAFEACAFTATPLCAAVKLLSVNISGTIDQYGNLYMGPQISWGKSVLPVLAISDYVGTISSGNSPHVPTEAETRDHLSGLAMSAGSIATGGVSYSPLAETYNTSYYIDGFPEIFSVNLNYNFLVHDFSP